MCMLVAPLCHLNPPRVEHTVREATKKPFFSGAATKALPLPSSLVAITFFGFFFSSFKKRYFFLVARPLPPLSGRATKKIPFLQLP